MGLKEYVKCQGPFDAILAFSLGATIAAAFIALSGTDYFKCAIFISGGSPPISERLRAQFTSVQRDGVITIPTGHILGLQDGAFAAGVELSELCSRNNRLVMEHSGGHEVPKGEKALADMIRLVNGVVTRALFAQ